MVQIIKQTPIKKNVDGSKITKFCMEKKCW